MVAAYAPTTRRVEAVVPDDTSPKTEACEQSERSSVQEAPEDWWKPQEWMLKPRLPTRRSELRSECKQLWLPMALPIDPDGFGLHVGE